MAERPNVAIFGPAVRTDKWMRFYESLGTNRATYEIFFVGDVKPDYELPPNFHYIYSTVKPAQCAYIGRQEALASNADFILNAADDCVYNRRCLDKLIRVFDTVGHDKFVSAARFYTAWPDKTPKERSLFFLSQYRKSKYCPFLPVGTLMSRKMWETVGNLDRRFVCSYWDVDIAMQMYAIGGDVRVHPKAQCREIKQEYSKNSSIIPIEHTQADRDLFYSLWCTLRPHTKKRFGPDNLISLTKPQMRKGLVKIMKTRSIPVEPYKCREDILTISQGPRGRWR